MKSLSGFSFVITNLMEINNQRVILYKLMVDKTNDIEMKLLFMQYAVQAQAFNAILNKWRVACGGDDHTKPRKLFHDFWKAFRKMFFVRSRNALLHKCHATERHALKMYNTAVEMSFVPAAAVIDLNRQRDELQRATTALNAIVTGRFEDWRVAFG